MARLDGKVAIITGAASGMGLAAAQLFAREGAKVVATDVSDALEGEVESIRTSGHEILAMHHDVASAESWADVVGATIEEFGTVDILVNNAGVHVAKGILETDEETWDRVLDINAKGVFLGMKAVIPTMAAGGGGSIVNCSSIAGIVGGDGDGNGAAYSASKGAVRSITKHAAQWHAKDRIRVNSVHPGAVLTGMSGGLASAEELGKMVGVDKTPLPPHAGEAIDIAYGYLYLACDESRFVTGEELVIDGGWITH